MATVSSSVSEDRRASPPALPWPVIAWFGVLLIACYAPLLWGLARQWATAEDMSHGFFVPIVAGAIAWRRRAEIAAVQAGPNYWGLALAAWGAMQMVLGSLAAQLFAARSAFLISLIGVVLFLGGVRALKPWPSRSACWRSCFPFPPF